MVCVEAAECFCVLRPPVARSAVVGRDEIVHRCKLVPVDNAVDVLPHEGAEFGHAVIMLG